MQKSETRWVKPELILLGKIADVAGNKIVNNNGASGNTKS